MNPWLLVGLLWVVGLLNYLDRQIIFSVFPLVSAELKLSSVQLGLVGSAFIWVYGLLSPVAGYLADRFGRVRTILVSLAVWSLVTWATGYARSFGELIAARAIMGVSEACYIPAALALIADRHDRSRALATGIHTSGIYAGIVIGGVGGGWMGQEFGWRFAFTVLGIAGVVYFVILAVLLRGDSASATTMQMPRLTESLSELLRLPAFVRLTAVFSAMAIANWIGYTWLPLYLYETFHVSLAEAGFTGTFYIQAGSFAGIVIGGRLSDSWATRDPRGRVFTQALGLGAAAPFLFLAGSTTWMPALIAALIFFGIGRGIFDANAMPVLCQIARPELRSTGYGIFNMVGCLAGGFIAAIAGALKDQFGLSVMLQAAAFLMFIAAIALVRLRAGAVTSQAAAGA